MPVHTVDLPDPAACAPLPPASLALVADPADFDVVWQINPHMRPGVDRARARVQWEAVVGALGDAGLELVVVPPVAGLCDLVFAANQSFPARDGSRRVIRARMRAPERRPEVHRVAEAWEARGWTSEPLAGDPFFEAGGDALWFPGRRLVLCGHGFRTERAALDALSDAVDAPVVAFGLVDPRYYHLDTCLCPLDDRCALYAEAAFTPDDVARIRALFPEAVAVPDAEAAGAFACNGAAVRGRFLVQRGADTAIAVARSRGLGVVELETGEFLKSGGSVTCLHMVA